METKKNNLYHIYRHGNKDEIWHPGNTITIDTTYKSALCISLLLEDKLLTERYGTYDIDELIEKLKT